MAAAVERYRAGDKAGAVTTFTQGVFESPLERRLPAVFAQAVADADAFFAQELPALQSWSFTQEDASRIRQPALAIRGENTAPTFPERMELLLSWLPNAEEFLLPSATHLLHLEDPKGQRSTLGTRSRHLVRCFHRRTRDRSTGHAARVCRDARAAPPTR